MTPTTDEIRAKALEAYMDEMFKAGLRDIPTPEDYELKEGNYWERAKIDLMTSPESKAKDELLEFLEYSASELEEVVVKSEDLKELLEASRKLEGVEERIQELKRKRRKEREEAKLRIAALERKLAEEREKVPPPPPPPPPTGLSAAQKTRLEDAFRRVFEEAGITKIPMATFRDELAGLQEDLKDVERVRAFELAYERIVGVARGLVAPRPPLVVVPPPVVAPPPRVEEVTVPAVTYLGPRRRRWEEFTCMKEDCWETVMLDRDLMHRVTLIPVLKAILPSGPLFEPLCRFPPRFYYKCPRHRKEREGYTGIYDYLAFALRESEIGDKMCVTKSTFSEIGLDDIDIEEIQKEKIKYLPQRGVPRSS